jgi:hypothetical protein
MSRVPTPAPTVGDLHALLERRVGILEAVPPPVIPDNLVSAVCAEWLNDGTVVTVDTYSGGTALKIPVWDYDIRGTDMAATGDGFSVTCGPGVYIAKATWVFDRDFDPATMFFDMQISGVLGVSTFSYIGSPHGAAQGFAGTPTAISIYGPTTVGVAPNVYIAQTDQWFVVGAGDTTEISTTVLTDTNGLQYVTNLSGAANPGASNLSILRVGG